jgi:hypothetical protein
LEIPSKLNCQEEKKWIKELDIIIGEFPVNVIINGRLVEM